VPATLGGRGALAFFVFLSELSLGGSAGVDSVEGGRLDSERDMSWGWGFRALLQ
jgi:hypothetical protein